MKWSELSPEERDRLVAIKVMEWNPDLPCDGTFIPLNPEPDGLYCRKCDAEIGWGDVWEHDAPKPPRYTQSMEWAWQIVEKMAHRMGYDNIRFTWHGPLFKPEHHYLTAEGYPLGTTCWYIHLEDKERIRLICADTAIEAICKASLIAVGVAIE